MSPSARIFVGVAAMGLSLWQSGYLLLKLRALKVSGASIATLVGFSLTITLFLGIVFMPTPGPSLKKRVLIGFGVVALAGLWVAIYYLFVTG
jgi:hypothetical protein